MADTETRGDGPTQANFLQFISGFAVQTLVHLGKMSNPMSGETAVDLPNAKYSIDILAVIQDKTRGNLTPQEEEYFSNMLRDLRLEYVDALKRGDNASGTGESRDGAANES